MDYSKRAVLQNENRVEWNVYLEERQNLKIIDTVPVDTHKCTPEELDSFYEVTADDKAFFQELKDLEALYCLDPNHQIDVRGQNEIDSVALNIDFVPCNKTKSAACARQTLEGL